MIAGPYIYRFLKRIVVALLIAIASATCVGDYADEPILLTLSGVQFKVGGEVQGLSGTLVLSNNGGDTLTINGPGAFQFDKSFPTGSYYDVQIESSPLNQECTISSNQGVLLGDISTVFVTCQNTSITIDSVQYSYVSASAGAFNNSQVQWTPSYSQNYEVRIGSDCTSGTLSTGANATGTSTAGSPIVSTILATDLVPGPNTIQLCIFSAGPTLVDSRSLTLTRDDVAPTVTINPAAGSYNATQSGTVSCSDASSGCNGSAIFSVQSVALPGSANPADPDVQADGTPITGTAYSSSIPISDLQNTQIEAIAVDNAGNKSAVVTANFSVDASLPSISPATPTNVYVSNAAGAYNTTDLAWTSDRSNSSFQIWKGASDCDGTGGTSIDSGTTTGAGDTRTINASLLDIGSNTITISESNLIGNNGCATVTVHRDDTAPSVIAGGTPSGSSLAYDDLIDIRLSEQILPLTIAVSGGDLDAEASLPPSVITTSNTDDTIRIAPTAGYWNPGASRALTVDVRDRAGNNATLNLTFDLPQGNVEPVYSAAANWNTHVRNDGSFVYDASGTACDGSEIGFITECIHGGDQHKVEVLTASSCAGLTATDANGWYDWTCVDPAGPGPVIFYSSGRNVALRNLINFPGANWNTNGVTVSNGWTTQSTAWWSNPIAVIPDTGMVMGVSGTVYIADSNLTMTGTIQYGQPNVTFVTGPGVILSTSIASHLIIINARNFSWLEATMRHTTGAGSGSGIFMRDSAFVRIENSQLSGFPGFGSEGQLRLINNRSSFFHNLIVANNPSSTGITVYADAADSSHLWFNSVRAFNNASDGLYFRGNSPGITRDMLVTNSIFANNGGNGIAVNQQLQNSLFMNDLAANNGAVGFNVVGSMSSQDNTLMNVVAVFNLTGGLRPGNNSQIINSGFAKNGGSDVEAPLAVGNYFSGVLYSGIDGALPDDQDGRCIGGGGGTGLANDDDCGVDGPSDHTVVSSFNLASQFVPLTGASQLYSITLNWFSVASPWNTFGNSIILPVVPSYPGTSQRNRCDGSALQGCVEFDWRLNSGAPSPGFRNALGCAGMTPAVTHTFTTGSVTFLRNSYALNTDLRWQLPMCLGDEQCLFTPNLGVYQGHGADIDSGCADLSGDPTFGNVDFRERPNNGVP